MSVLSVRETQVFERPSELQWFRYNIIGLDPAWEFETYSDKGKAKSAEAQYDVMSFEEIEQLPIGEIASDECMLFMWVCEWVTPGQRQRLLDKWGFRYVSTIIWRKTTVNGKSRWGMGYRFRSLHEPIIVGAIGKPQHKAFPSEFPGLAREHSRKPDEFYDMIDQSFPEHYRRVDIFSRQSRPGWDVVGNEATKFDQPNIAGSDRKEKLLSKPTEIELIEAAGQYRLLD